MENKVIGVLRETKNVWECRTPLTPSDAGKLIVKGIRVILQPSTFRIFSDSDYTSVGAEINEDLSEALIILGVKEVLPKNFWPDRIYIFFSHTFKGQYYNMPMLDSMISNRITLVDIELLKDPSGRRTVALGEFCGNAAAVDFMQGLGKYLLMKNISSPFLYQGFAYMYPDLEAIRMETTMVGELVTANGLSASTLPMIWGILGTGRTSGGLQAILRLLPHQFIAPEELQQLFQSPVPESQFRIYIVIFPTASLFSRKTDGGFDRQEYQDMPHLYESVFALKYARYLSVIFNCLYYESKYPRVLTVEDIRKLDRLLGICDISCDLNGAIEICRKFTTPEEPFFLYKPSTDRMYELCKTHVQGSILYYSMDFLPTELPLDASNRLSERLLGYVEELTRGDYSGGVENTGLSREIVEAMFLYKGVVAERYRYVQEFRGRNLGYPATDSVKQIREILKKCPELASDVDNTRCGQEMKDESKRAIIQIANILRNT